MNHEEHATLDELLTARLESQDVTCPVYTLSEIIRTHQIERIDLLKVDVEKSELAVLAGIEEDDWSKIRQIVVETSKDGDRLTQVTALLERHGYMVAVERDTMLQEADLYNVYALRPSYKNLSEAPPEAPLQPIAQRYTWSNAERLKSDVRDMLEGRLPDYMIPAQIVFLDALPLTDNGKVDRRALPAPSESRTTSQRAFVPPQTELEQTIARVWQEVLGREAVGMEDNFFDLGGHSLLMIRTQHKLRHVLDRELSIVDLFRYPTVGSLAKFVAQGQRVAQTPPQVNQQRVARAEGRREAMKQQRSFRQQQRSTRREQGGRHGQT